MVVILNTDCDIIILVLSLMNWIPVGNSHMYLNREYMCAAILVLELVKTV